MGRPSGLNFQGSLLVDFYLKDWFESWEPLSIQRPSSIPKDLFNGFIWVSSADIGLNQAWYRFGLVRGDGSIWWKTNLTEHGGCNTDSTQVFMIRTVTHYPPEAVVIQICRSSQVRIIFINPLDGRATQLPVQLEGRVKQTHVLPIQDSLGNSIILLHMEDDVIHVIPKSFLGDCKK